MRRRPVLSGAIGQVYGQPARLAEINDFIISQSGSQPYSYRSAYDQVGKQPWEKVPLPIVSVVAVEGVDYPFRSRIWVDNAQRNHRKRWADRSRAAQPQVAPVPLVLIAPTDTTPLFTGNRDETPLGWAVWQKRRRALVAATPPTWQWGARMAAYLPATVYPDTSCRIYSEIQRHMLESPINTGLTWTTMWTTTEVESYLTQRLALFLVDSGLIRERRDVAATSSEVTLPSDSLDVLRTVWNDGASRSVLVRIDKWALDNGAVGWQATPGTPLYYTEDTNSALGAEVAPSPAAPGTLELVIIAAPPVQRAHCYSINLPAIFTSYLKWGVIADMLSKEGEAQDPQRAAYAEARFTEGVELAKLFFAGGKTQ
jgi:hypothetical protein